MPKRHRVFVSFGAVWVTSNGQLQLATHFYVRNQLISYWLHALPWNLPAKSFFDSFNLPNFAKSIYSSKILSGLVYSTTIWALSWLPVFCLAFSQCSLSLIPANQDWIASLNLNFQVTTIQWSLPTQYLSVEQLPLKVSHASLPHNPRCSTSKCYHNDHRR